MKVLRIVIEAEFMAEPGWALVSPGEDEDKALLFNGKFYEPIVSWLELEKMTSNEHGSESIWAPPNGELLQNLAEREIKLTLTMSEQGVTPSLREARRNAAALEALREKQADGSSKPDRKELE